MIETSVIPAVRQVIYTTYANFPTSGLTISDLAWATDRLCLYRWSGSTWESIGISSRHGAYADIGNPADYPESSLYQADDQDKLYMIRSGAWALITFLPTELEISLGASDSLKNSDDAEKSSTLAAYTKKKEVKVNEAYNGVMRIKFDLKSSSPVVYGRIYKNGVAIGTEQSTSSSSYVTFTEDLALTLVPDDLLQIYVKHDGSGTVYVSNFRFYYDNRLNKIGGNTLVTDVFITKAAISTTNQDP
jgi:hypothetical protein